ncbi:hypothetical protein ZIOFF_004687 [Zingiber officinale]|uniref:Uncharacterized protein n=1 Tax=Zingiber officinale TaxID=94328 RepID=A0A8J5LM25_ZINOF|nr:hypothetical protein ZIOFF_004687 [Zingiber officinale]
MRYRLSWEYFAASTSYLVACQKRSEGKVSSQMAILYALVARGSVVLAEFSASPMNAGAVARQILERIPGSQDTHVSYSQDRYIFHVKCTDGLTVLCVADDTAGSESSLSLRCYSSLTSVPAVDACLLCFLEKNILVTSYGHFLLLSLYTYSQSSNAQLLMKVMWEYRSIGQLVGASFYTFKLAREFLYHTDLDDMPKSLSNAKDASGGRIPFAFLEDIHGRFVKTYGRACHTAPAYGMNDEFSRVLSQQIDYYSSDPNADRMNRIKGEMSQVRNVMIENIDKVLERGDRLELLVDKTANMQGNTIRFRKQARRFRNTVWWRNIKLTYAICTFQLLVSSFFSCNELYDIFYSKKP